MQQYILTILSIFMNILMQNSNLHLNLDLKCSYIPFVFSMLQGHALRIRLCRDQKHSAHSRCRRPRRRAYKRRSNMMVLHIAEQSKEQVRIWTHVRFQARSQTREKRLLASSCLSVCPSIRMEKLGSRWMYFYEILYLRVFFRKIVQKIQILFKSDKNNEYST